MERERERVRIYVHMHTYIHTPKAYAAGTYIYIRMYVCMYICIIKYNVDALQFR
jgi:hypothetical protein